MQTPSYLAVKLLLETGMTAYWRKVNAALIEDVSQAYHAWATVIDLPDEVHAERRADGARQMVEFLLYSINQQRLEILALRQRFADFNKQYRQVMMPEEKKQVIIDFARDLGARPRQLRGDRRAFSRWFGEDAVRDRYLRRHGAAERKLSFCLHCLGTLAAELLHAHGASVGYTTLWHRLSLESALIPLFAYRGDWRVASAAFQCLATVLQAIPFEMHEGSVTDSALRYIYRSALESRQHVPIQCAAFDLLQHLSSDSLLTALTTRLSHPQGGDDLFVRRRAVRLIEANLKRLPNLRDPLSIALIDPSPFVRQGAAQALRSASKPDLEQGLQRLIHYDPVPQVRAAAVLALPDLLDDPELVSTSLELLRHCLQHDTDVFVLRVGLTVASEGLQVLLRGGFSESALQWRDDLLADLEHLHTTADNLAVRRWAAQSRERLWCSADPTMSSLHLRLERLTELLQPGRVGRLPRKLLADHDRTTVGRLLSVLAQQDFGYDLYRSWLGPRLTRGHVFGFRLWRVLHECRHPSPDKRQAFRHTVGRIFRGDLRAPSAVLSELAETKVPGEPLYMESEAGWRPYLPLVDEVISSLDHSLFGKPVCIFTSEGMTEVKPPGTFFRRLWSRVVLTWRFAHYARLRNWRERSQQLPTAYLQALHRLGFRVRLTPYPMSTDTTRQSSLDPAVTRFFLPAALPLFDSAIAQQLKHYFLSFYENSLIELALFLAVAMAFFFGRHLYVNHIIHVVRKRLPLVIGGWGTRGKSGTERLKAALLNGLGYGVVSKTTGCEAMFLYAPPYRPLQEMFLFRPYDKATIWEQYHLSHLAQRLNTEIFLWECMALTPAFVHLLQRHWMRDDIATLTNTYPDHEDIQGPAGINIPDVMTQFIPASGLLLTSEEQMFPVLQVAAQKLKTQVRAVGWLEAGLLTPDVLERFPYEEHPYNVALTLAVADELGIESDMALKTMADQVVPDLGVLKAYPAAPLRSRQLAFVNGMSANERFGCLGNWTRMGFDSHNPRLNPGVWISTVVNNRADRIARSRVFAKILVTDVSADRHFLIGTNLPGLQGYIQEAWAEFAQDLTLQSASGESALEVLSRMAEHMRIATCPDDITARLQAMLPGSLTDTAAIATDWSEPERLRSHLHDRDLEDTADAILEQVRQETATYDDYCAFRERIEGAATRELAGLEADFRALMWTWFQRKLVVIEDAHVSGNEVIARICEETPPGYLNRIMGMQNIKGTGLDFVYAWQAWAACHQACVQMRDPDPDVVSAGLQALASFQDYNLLCVEYVRETLDKVRETTRTNDDYIEAELGLIEQKLDATVETARDQSPTGQHSRLFSWVITALEGFFDTGDAVRRRKTANRIYQDLAHERISHARATLELQALNQRQKGGWLLKKTKETFQRCWSAMLSGCTRVRAPFNPIK